MRLRDHVILRLETSAGESLVVRDGHIADPDTRADTTLQVGAGRFLPGLINAHDHLHRNHYPRLGWPPYVDAYAWGLDIHARCGAAIDLAKTLDQRDALLFGALKNVIAGVTTVVHHDRWEPLFDEQFPVRVPRVRTLHSLGFELEPVATFAAASGMDDAPLCIHLAEGTNRRAADEVATLGSFGLLGKQLLAVHAVGVDDRGIERLRAAGAAVIWCPTSNGFLFGRTVPSALFDAGIDVLLGTDALLTGDGTLLDELRAARAIGGLSDHALLAAVGATAARRLGLPPPSVSPGSPADVVVMRAPIFEARPADVALVLVRGRPVLADASFGDVIGADAEAIDVAGVKKLVAAPLARAAERALAMVPECGRIFT